jgi:hypothetical protein
VKVTRGLEEVRGGGKAYLVETKPWRRRRGGREENEISLSTLSTVPTQITETTLN